MIGIYKITNPKGRIYIGQSVDIEKRFKKYKLLHCELQYKIYRSLLKYGVDKHKFEIVQICNKEQLNELEKYYVDLFQTFNSNYGLNLRDGGAAKGRQSYETKQKMSISKRNISNETRLKMSKSGKGRFVSDETKHKISKGNTGKKRSNDAKLKMSENKKGCVVSEKTRKIMSEKRIGKKQSEETKNKISLSNGKIVLDTQNGIYYFSLKEAAFIYGFNRVVLSRRLTGILKNNTNLIYV